MGANKNSHYIKQDQWKKSIKDIDYTERYKEFEKDETPNKETDIAAPPKLSYSLGGFKYVFYVIVFGLVLFLIIKVLSNLQKNPNIKKTNISIEHLEEIEEKMHEIDLEELLNEAIKNNNFRVALRLNFLIIIKLLSERKLIIWAKEKTNWEYFSELKDVAFKGGFKNIIVVFEPVWYGEHPLTEEMFYQIQPVFGQFKEQLKPHE